MEHDTEPRPRDHAILHDHVALDEIELYAEVLIAVADADHRLTPDEIDRVLGVSSSEDAAGAADEAPVPRADTADGRYAPPVRTERPARQVRPTGPPPRTPDRSPATRPPAPCGEAPQARVLPATGPLFPATRVLPEAPPFADVLPVPFDGPLTAWSPPDLPLTPWPP
ncbi:hypothetical protein HNR06_001965 [Nocardiopsis arvandica]|uniref:Uncharacterized protein n=1 Tax=Nocardiopsis sinuspersici TaxID=501010 RepID=A0A7Y9XAT3_9ACTN|nr:hypothetical protein [Nocardiopsis sinuspersici]